MSERPSYEVVVVGGGPAGMTTALYTTRLGHRTAAFETKGGRHAAVTNVHNLLGVSEDVSGSELARHGVEQFQEYGGTYYLDEVTAVDRTDGDDGRFVVDATHAAVEADRLVLATGFTDVGPSVPGLERFTGRGLHYCLHCDAYTLGDGPVFVLGHDDHAASVAMLMLNFTADVDLLLNGHDSEWSDETEAQLRAHPVDRIETPAVDAFARDDDAEFPDADPWLGGLAFEDGTEREYLGGFAMYGSEYNTELADSLGCDLDDDGALVVDETFETSVEGVYGVGDLTHGQNQTVVALGDGAKAGVAIHKDLRRYPLAPDELDELDPSDVPATSAELRSHMRLDRDVETHAGLRRPKPDR